MPDDLPIVTFKTRAELRSWLEKNSATHGGVWVRIFKASSGIDGVTFEDVLDEGLCFGWSESTRRPGDGESYLQRFTPRRKVGTVSERNRQHVQRLMSEGLMTAAGLAALGLA